MDTRQIVTELYSLRAGLSLIAKEKDAYDKKIRIAEETKETAIARARASAERVIKSENAKLTDARESSDSEQIKLDNLKYHADDCRRRYETNSRILENTQYATKKHKYIRAVILRILWFFCPIIYLGLAVLLHIFYSNPFVTIPIVAVLCLEITLFYIISKDFEFSFIIVFNILDVLGFVGHIILYYCGVQAWHGGTYFMVCMPTLLITIGSIASLIMKMTEDGFKFDDTIKDYEYHIKEKERAAQKQSELRKAADEAECLYEKMRKTSHNNDELIDSKVKECEKIIRQAEQELDTQLTSACKQYQAACAAASQLHGNVCSSIWDTLVRTYGDLLDVRDWGILDLVVWQLETGRAETLKEALQLADRETQTDRIVQTMQSASAAIAQRIDTGFGNLQTQLSNSFYTLATGLAKATSIISGQISRSSDMLIGKIDESAQATALLYENQNNAMLTTNKNIEQLFSQASLQTALLEKSNSSSKDLIEAVNNLRKAQNT